jgi:hypothetical protein
LKSGGGGSGGSSTKNDMKNALWQFPKVVFLTRRHNTIYTLSLGDPRMVLFREENEKINLKPFFSLSAVSPHT